MKISINIYTTIIAFGIILGFSSVHAQTPIVDQACVDSKTPLCMSQFTDWLTKTPAGRRCSPRPECVDAMRNIAAMKCSDDINVCCSRHPVGMCMFEIYGRSAVADRASSVSPRASAFSAMSSSAASSRSQAGASRAAVRTPATAAAAMRAMIAGVPESAPASPVPTGVNAAFTRSYWSPPYCPGPDGAECSLGLVDRQGNDVKGHCIPQGSCVSDAIVRVPAAARNSVSGSAGAMMQSVLNAAREAARVAPAAPVAMPPTSYPAGANPMRPMRAE